MIDKDFDARLGFALAALPRWRWRAAAGEEMNACARGVRVGVCELTAKCDGWSFWRIWRPLRAPELKRCDAGPVSSGLSVCTFH